MAISRISMWGFMGNFFGSLSRPIYMHKYEGSSAKIGELACMPWSVAILTGLQLGGLKSLQSPAHVYIHVFFPKIMFIFMEVFH